MTWKQFSLHFKQIVVGGYRYLDKCGEFILLAEKIGFMSDEVSVSGAKLTFPERGILAVADSHQVVITQEFCDEKPEEFLQLSAELSKTYFKTFEPSRIESNGFASKSFLALKSLDAVFAQSLKLGDTYHVELGKLVGMVPSQKKVDCHFTSGSYDLHVLAQPVTFSDITVRRQNAGALTTDSQKKRIERLNKRVQRIDNSLAHAVMLEVDLVEFNPPSDSLKGHFDDLKKKEAQLQERLFTQ